MYKQMNKKINNMPKTESMHIQCISLIVIWLKNKNLIYHQKCEEPYTCTSKNTVKQTYMYEFCRINDNSDRPFAQ